MHPALSADGRWLAFTRMRIVPKLDGSFPVPAERNIVLVDLQAGQVVPFTPGVGGAGPMFLHSGLSPAFSNFTFGLTPVQGVAGPAFDGSAQVARDFLQSNLPPGGGVATLSTDLRASTTSSSRTRAWCGPRSASTCCPHGLHADLRSARDRYVSRYLALRARHSAR